MFEVFAKYLQNQIQLNDQELNMIQKVCVSKRLRKNQYLLQEGDVWRYNAFITSGCLRTYSVNDKLQEHILNFAIENYWIGDRESLLNGTPSRYNIDAIEDSEVLLISKEDFAVLMKSIPQFQDLVNLIIERSFAASQDRINSSISLNAEEKYATFLKRQPKIANRVPQHMVASYLGITPETLSRIRKLNLKK
ncbi:Crp/Fnr family transcriptional regulator [Flavobacterium psychroterrae]|uniref:Crp/Fnr family transcriptional regulator n=1 Tax=Flavobacterium psychroterrae TaxID=2133767 RepID=A0ABS5PEQ7_9FLAO|nr:Crp/Fnr family transcriptional regulator [Flavobacterium psychroterrae]MBS7232606.1 Crp/Fnr family transcriptional regulator [Flavobacterium psychroterrae]